MIGATVSDLEEGDVLPPFEYHLSAHAAREYARATEWFIEDFHDSGPDAPRYAPPSLIHAFKVRLLNNACPGGPGPQARMHYEYRATHHRPLRIGQTLLIAGRVDSRYVRRGRQFMTMSMDVRDADDDGLVASYDDISLMRYEPVEGSRS